MQKNSANLLGRSTLFSISWLILPPALSFHFFNLRLMRPSSTFLLIFFFACIGSSLSAQRLVALQHQGAGSFFTTLQGAYDAAVNGDTIYLPGGTFDGITLQKSLVLIGVGHHPDSTLATGRTVISGLTLYTQASGSYITGLYMTGTLTTQGIVTQVTVYRCYLEAGINFNNGTSENWIIAENYIGPYYCYYFGYCGLHSIYGSASYLFLSNNIIQTQINTLNTSEVNHNVFLSGNLSANQSQIRNNVFYSGANLVTSNSTWTNNLNNGVNGYNGGNTGSGNYLVNEPLTTIFTNYSLSNTFYQNDFHVTNSAYLGDDSTPVGIYGGAFPWKPGSLPFSPHIRTKVIGSTSNPDGTLHINLTVKAQGN